MKNNKLLGVVLWLLGLIVAHLTIFCLPKSYTAAVWITYGFTLFAFLSQLALWLYIWREPIEADGRFLHTPVLTLSVGYMLLQLVPCLVFTLWSAASPKIVVLANALLLIAMWALLVLAMIGKSHIQRVDSRQKNHHVEL